MADFRNRSHAFFRLGFVVGAMSRIVVDNFWR